MRYAVTKKTKHTELHSANNSDISNNTKHVRILLKAFSVTLHVAKKANDVSCYFDCMLLNIFV